MIQQMVDWDKDLITGKDLDLLAVDNKYSEWDLVIRNNLLASDDEKVRNKALRLLNDPSIYEYALFKDELDEPIRYTAYQDLIANCKHDFTQDGDNRYLLFRASNQLGKSRLLIGLAKKIALTEDNRNIVMISKSISQSQFLLSELRKSLNNSAFGESWKEDIGDTSNTTMLTFERKEKKPNGEERTIINRIICAPAGEGSLGYPMHYLFLDEADFYEDAKNLFWKVFFPRTKKTKGQIILFSNPNPLISKNDSLLWELWGGKAKELFKKKFHFQFLDAPWNTLDEFERDKRNSPSHIFASTHMGDWSEEGGSFLTEREIKDMMNHEWNNDRLPSVDRPVYVSADLGKMNDNTVFSIGITKKPKYEDDKFLDLECLYQEELPLGTTYDEIMRRYVEIKEHYDNNGYGVAMFGYDSTGQKTFGDFLKRYGVSGQGVDFSKKESNKTLLVNDFKLMVENRKLKVAYSSKCEYQLGQLVFKYTSNKKMQKVENKSTKDHDDFFDSLLILVHIAVKPSRLPPSATIVSSKEQEQKIITTHDSAKDYIANTIAKNNSFNKQGNYGAGNYNYY